MQRYNFSLYLPNIFYFFCFFFQTIPSVSLPRRWNHTRGTTIVSVITYFNRSTNFADAKLVICLRQATHSSYCSFG